MVTVVVQLFLRYPDANAGHEVAPGAIDFLIWSTRKRTDASCDGLVGVVLDVWMS
jgi:hypothetical protein